MSIFDFLGSDPNPDAQPLAASLPTRHGNVAAEIPGLTIRGAQPYGMFGTGPLSHGQKLALAAAGLRDAIASVQGRPAENFAQAQQQVMQTGIVQQQAQARQAYARAMQAGDARAILQARAQLIASGAVPANYAFPQMQRGYVLSADGTEAEAVRGGPADPRVIAQRAAARRGQLPPPAPAQTVVPGVPAFYSYDENGDPQP
jgi:hypothetical protein